MKKQKIRLTWKVKKYREPERLRRRFGNCQKYCSV